MIKLLDLLAKFQSANERMEKWQFRGQNKAEKSQELSAEKAYVMGQINAEELSGQAKDIDTNRWKRIRVTNDATMKQVQLEMNRVSQRMAAVSKQQAALTSQATSLTIGIAASVTGLPVDVVTNAAKGDLKAAVIGYATAELSNPNSPLSSELNSLGSTLVESNKTISQLYTKYKDAAELKNDLEFAAASIREPSLERFLKVGEIAYSKLDAGQVQALDQLIEQQKPVQAWIQAAYQKAVAVNGQAEQFRKSLQNIINFIDTSSQEFNSKIGNFNDQVTGLLLQEFRKAKLQGDDAIRNMETQLLQNLKGLAIEQNNQLSILINALTIYPNYLAQANPPLWADLKAVYPNATNEWLAQQVISAGMVALNNLEKDKQKIVPSMVIVFDEAGKFKINSQKNSTYNIGSEILQKSINIDLKTLRTNVDEQVNALMSTVAQKANSQRQTQALLSYAATVASPEAAASFVAKLIPVGDASKINAMWDSIKTVNGELTKQAQMGVRYAAAASIAAPAIPQSAPAPAPAPVDVSIPGADPEQAKQSAMLSMALNAAFPGAGVALQLVQNFAAMDANRQLSEQLNQQSVQLMAAMNELMKASGDIDSNEAISQKEYARAIALADAAKAQLGQYNATIDTVLSSTQDVDVRIRLYRPYYFYLAELLRQQFDLFDRSLAMWSGASDSRGFFATQIASDPAQARLALDSEIHLFDWLNRDREATKTDPFVLFVHWQQLVALAQGYCADHGCKPGDNQLGQIGITARRSIFDDLGTPELRGQFEQWKKGPMNGPFKFSITLDPSKRLLPDRFVNVRNLDWNVVPTTRKGTVAGNFLQVRHLGHAQIPYQKDQLGIRFRDESMLPTTFSPSNRSAAFDLTALSDRFQSQTGITSLQTLRALEGYGVYGQYEITVLNTPPARDFDDFMVEIAYIYTDPSNITSERMFMNSISEPAKGACKEPNGRNPDVPNCREIFYFATDGCVGPPPTDPLLWLDSSPGLEFLFATKPDKNARVRTLCYAKVPIPVVQQAMNLQRVSRNCTWTNAIAYIKNGTKSACSGGVK